MSKYLQKPCVDIRVISLLILRRQDEETLEWQTKAYLRGEAIDEDGTTLEQIRKNINVGDPGEYDWDADSFESDLTTIASVVKSKYNQVLAEYTIE